MHGYTGTPVHHEHTMRERVATAVPRGLMLDDPIVRQFLGGPGRVVHLGVVRLGGPVAGPGQSFSCSRGPGRKPGAFMVPDWSMNSQ